MLHIFCVCLFLLILTRNFSVIQTFCLSEKQSLPHPYHGCTQLGTFQGHAFPLSAKADGLSVGSWAATSSAMREFGAVVPSK